MNLTIELHNPNQLEQTTRHQICELAAQGFGRENDPDMQADTLHHIQEAAAVQLARRGERIEAFAVYGRSLWRPCY